jgi:hypothetical protein
MIPEIKLAYYREKDWDKLMKSIADRESMHDTWEEWSMEYDKTKTLLKKQGFVVHDITIDIDNLNQYCIEKKLINNGKTRSQYVSQLPLTKKKNKWK